MIGFLFHVLRYPDGRVIQCDGFLCSQTFLRHEDYEEFPSSALHPYPDTLRLCRACAGPHYADLLEQEREKLEDRMEAGDYIVQPDGQIYFI